MHPTPLDFVVEVKEDDYQPLDSFKLKWRWTDAKYNLLPPGILCNIRPLVAEKAYEVRYKNAVVDLDTDEVFSPGTYRLVDVLDARDEDAQQVRDWLRLHIPSLEEELIVSWDANHAVVTTGAIFCDYWDDFCYPGGEDVSISPLSGKWVVWYWHEEFFYFGKQLES